MQEGDSTPDCCNNNLSLNINKAKELIVAFRKEKLGDHATVFMGRIAVERGGKILCVNVDGLSWNEHIAVITKSTSVTLLRIIKRFRR